MVQLSSALDVKGSMHDFTLQPGYPAGQGTCAACHVPHYSREIFLWPRDAVTTAGLSFVAQNVTELCLDCHGTGPSSLGWTRNAPIWAHTPYSAYRVSGAPPLTVPESGAHDLRQSPDVSAGSPCSACHSMHMPNTNTQAYQGTFYANAFFWSRDITHKLTDPNLTQKRDLDNGTPPNYVVGATIFCYECHSGTDLENTPFSDIAVRTPPVNIAFNTDLGQVNGAIGYYELSNGALPGGAFSAPSIQSVKSRFRSPGGHYVISPMNNGGMGASYTANFPVSGPGGRLLYKASIGDKLPCDLCHDPHLGVVDTGADDQVFFRRNILGGLGTTATNPHSAFDNALKASAKTRYGTGNGRLMCFYCHGSSDWNHDINSSPSAPFIRPLRVGNSLTPVTVYGIKINMNTLTDKPTDGSSWAFPPPRNIPAHAYSSGSVTEPCTNCHLHNNVGASCSKCHAYPPHTGAHDKHYAPPPYGPGLNCAACHGPLPGSAGWHNPGGKGAYSSTDDYGGITLMAELTAAQRTTPENAYFFTTWTLPGYAPTPKVTKAPRYAFTCSYTSCHGMARVTWTWQAMSSVNPAASPGYRTCGGCHGMGSDGYGRRVYASSFRTRAGSSYKATSAAANYRKPLSGFSRGGHGDTAIYNQTPPLESAPDSELPVACGSCHDGGKPHFPPANDDPYRMSTNARINRLPGWELSPQESRITNLCTQTNCHPKFPTSTTYGILMPDISAHRHGSDHYPVSGSTKLYYIKSAAKRIIRPGPSDNTDATYNPASLGGSFLPVGVDIDRYVDHWQWWGTPATLADTTDGHPFMPLGDSLGKLSTGSYNNVADSTTLVTCITCHNPHGSDLFVYDCTPGQPNQYVLIPNNKMLRLRFEDNASDELCDACH